MTQATWMPSGDARTKGYDGNGTQQYGDGMTRCNNNNHNPNELLKQQVKFKRVESIE